MPYLDYYAGKLLFIEFSEVCRISKEFPEKLFVLVAQDTDSFPLDELVKTCRFLISGGSGFFVTDGTPSKRSWIFKDGVECEVIDREFAKQLLTKANAKKKTVVKPTCHYKAFEATVDKPRSE